MNKDEIIRMAREAGFEKTRIYKSKIVRRIDNIGAVERLISIAFAAGVAAEREACAGLCEEPGWNAANWCAKQIRARGKA